MGKTLRKIPTTRFERGIKLFKLGASIGAEAIGRKVSGVLSRTTEGEKLLAQVGQAKKLVETLGQMKGAAMKLGQILSIHGEDLFPREVTDILARLQASSDPMEYAKIHKVLLAELGEKLGTELTEVSAEPIASASIGQVHSGLYTPDRLPVAVKVQYPGIAKSIDSDVDALSSVFSMIAKIPKAPGFQSVTAEIKAILKQETNYLTEADNGEFFRTFFAGSPGIHVPRVIRSVSTTHVLVTELIDGMSVQEFADSDATQEQRNAVGEIFMQVFYSEIFLAGRVQTDPNFANYKIQIRDGKPRLVLLDFGACKTFDEKFRKEYRQLMGAGLADDFEGIRQGALRLGFLREDDIEEAIAIHYEMVKLFFEPFYAPYSESHPYVWAKADLASRIRKLMPRFLLAFKLRPPPRDIIFLNRKIAGTYFFLSTIRAELAPKGVLTRVLNSV